MRMDSMFVRVFGALSVLFMCSGCLDEKGTFSLHMDTKPSGWQTISKRSKLLARSYPNADWVTVIVTPGKKLERVLTAPMPFVPSKQRRSIWSRGRGPMFAGRRAPTQKKPSREVAGFLFHIQVSHPMMLSIRVHVRNALSQKVAFVSSLMVRPAKARWRAYRLPFSSFKKAVKTTTATFSKGALTGKLAFWTKRAAGPERVTMTLRRPAVYRAAKAHKKGTKAPTTRPASRPSTRPASQPTTRQTPTSSKTRPIPTTRPASAPSTRP